MALFMEAVKGKKFKCDGCKEVFAGENVKLEPAPTNISAINLHMPFLFVDKDGIIKGGSSGPDGKEGDLTAHCPLCNKLHLFGFDAA